MSARDLDIDLALALDLQWQFDSEANQEVAELLPPDMRTPGKKGSKAPTTSLVAPEWEDLDPTPDLHALFRQFDERFFWSRLVACEVKWSPRMTLCAGVCSYQRRSGYCSIRLSVPLLKLRPRSDLVETLLHEMIHAYLFVTDGNDDHDGHGPAFHEHMYRINREAKTKISVYHNFHDEVAAYQNHWWQCDGPCRGRKPYYGMVKRSMNRAPGPNDRWWAEHQSTCGGTFVKIKEPEGYGKKKSKRKLQMEDNGGSKKGGQRDIRSFVSGGKENKAKNNSNAATGSKDPEKGPGGGARGNIFGFGGTSFAGNGGAGVKTKGKSGAMVVNPGWKTPADNSSSGQAIGGDSQSETSQRSDAGRRLGGDPQSSQSFAAPARQNVRDAWNARFPSSKGKDYTSSSVKSKKNTSNDKSQGHTASSSKSNDNAASGGKSRNEDSDPADAVCPVCSTKVRVSEINSHLDECLTRSALSESSSNSSLSAEASEKCPGCRREVYKGEMGFHRGVCSGNYQKR